VGVNESAEVEFQVEDDPDPLDIGFLETQIRREASTAMELGDEVELAIFVRDAGKVVAGISGWTWGDCCELQSLWVEPRLRGRWIGPRLLAAAEARRRRAGARRPYTSPTVSSLVASMSGPATNWLVESKTSHQERTSFGYRKRLNPPVKPWTTASAPSGD
jgi:GNAT superfamily N-acetyltransferase